MRALVFGCGISGVAAARLLLQHGVDVTVSTRQRVDSCAELEAVGAYLCVGEPIDAVSEFVKGGVESAFAVISPGIALSAPELVACRDAGLSIMGELELGASYYPGRMIAITGSKGKSSLVKFIAHALNEVGITACPCGNYGTAMSEVAAQQDPPHVAVVECSSFQLESLGDRFKPETALILNLSRDHLDRHGDMATYGDAKLAVFQNMNETALRLMPIDAAAPNLMARYSERYGRTAEIFGNDVQAQWSTRTGQVVHTHTGQTFQLSGCYFDNPILRPAAAAACAVLDREGLSVEQIEHAFKTFEPLAHRMQPVGELNGIQFVDDSKATSIAALLAGVEMAQKPVFLIAGGRLKEKIEVSGKEVVTTGVQKAYLIGECMDDMALAWSPDLPLIRCGTMDEAFRLAVEEAHGGGTILLSPGTASFDQFSDYKKRGEYFAELAKSLIASYKRS